VCDEFFPTTKNRVDEEEKNVMYEAKNPKHLFSPLFLSAPLSFWGAAK
jgi:hypothetical protein